MVADLSGRTETGIEMNTRTRLHRVKQLLTAFLVGGVALVAEPIVAGGGMTLIPDGPVLLKMDGVTYSVDLSGEGQVITPVSGSPDRPLSEAQARRLIENAVTATRMRRYYVNGEPDNVLSAVGHLASRMGKIDDVYLARVAANAAGVAMNPSLVSTAIGALDTLADTVSATVDTLVVGTLVKRALQDYEALKSDTEKFSSTAFGIAYGLPIDVGEVESTKAIFENALATQNVAVQKILAAHAYMEEVGMATKLVIGVLDEGTTRELALRMGFDEQDAKMLSTALTGAVAVTGNLNLEAIRKVYPKLRQTLSKDQMRLIDEFVAGMVGFQSTAGAVMTTAKGFRDMIDIDWGNLSVRLDNDLIDKIMDTAIKTVEEQRDMDAEKVSGLLERFRQQVQQEVASRQREQRLKVLKNKIAQQKKTVRDSQKIAEDEKNAAQKKAAALKKQMQALQKLKGALAEIVAETMDLRNA